MYAWALNLVSIATTKETSEEMRSRNVCWFDFPWIWTKFLSDLYLVESHRSVIGEGSYIIWGDWSIQKTLLHTQTRLTQRNKSLVESYVDVHYKEYTLPISNFYNLFKNIYLAWMRKKLISLISATDKSKVHLHPSTYTYKKMMPNVILNGKFERDFRVIWVDVRYHWYIILLQIINSNGSISNLDPFYNLVTINYRHLINKLQEIRIHFSLLYISNKWAVFTCL